MTNRRNAHLPKPLMHALGALLVISSSTLLSGCFDAEANNKKEDKQVEISLPVEVTDIQVGSISSDYVTTAVLEAKEEAFVVARASGIIEKIFVEEGDFVEKGQVLAQLETERYKLNLDRARADLKGIEKELSKINKVYDKKLVSDDTFDKLTAQYESAKASLAIAELDLKETTIVAPISGFIAQRNAKVGNLTESFQRERMFHIVQQNTLYGVVHLPEKELPFVHTGQPAQLSVTALDNKIISASVERISPVIDATSGTFKVTLKVPNDNNVLKAGMFSQVRLNYATHEHATLLPRRALLAIDDQTNVFVVEEGKARRVAVTTGFENGNMVEILSGLKGGEKVVITGHQNLKDQAPVDIVNG